MAPVGLEGLLTHSNKARLASSSLIAFKSMPPRSLHGTATARHPAKVAPISYVGYATAGYKTVSSHGERNFIHCGNVPTNSLVPIQAAMSMGAIVTLKRRNIQAAKASRKPAEPIDGGYPRSLLLCAKAAITEAGGGSHGVPMDRSISPPSKAAAKGLNESRRS